MNRIAFWTCILTAVFSVNSGVAQTLQQSPRPEARPSLPIVEVAGTAVALERTPRPRMRSADILKEQDIVVQLAASRAGFDVWVRGFRERAQTQGIRRETLDAAFRGVVFDTDVIKRDRNQSEFSGLVPKYTHIPCFGGLTDRRQSLHRLEHRT